MKGHVGKSHITTGVKKVDTVALLCPSIGNKYI